MPVLACILALRLTPFLSQCVGRNLMLSSPKVWESLGLRLYWMRLKAKREGLMLSLGGDAVVISMKQ